MNTVTRQPAPVAEETTMRPSRDTALDFTKGALVLCMIFYHTLNYFRHDVNLLRHIHFLPPSFIFLAGFVVSHIYLKRTRESLKQIQQRLFVRGLKTFTLFVGLNLLVHALISTSHNRQFGLELFLENLDLVFLSGEQRASVFGILLPISYLLLLASVLVRLSGRVALAIPIFAVALFAACVLLNHFGQLVLNLEMVSMGLLGMLVGYVSPATLRRTVSNLPVMLSACLIYNLIVRFWYPTYLMNTAGVGLWLALFYAAGQKTRSGAVLQGVTLLGNYTLLSYLVQIAILQVLFRVAPHIGFQRGDVILPLLTTAALTLLVIKVVDWLRQQSRISDHAYKAVFA